MTKAGAQLTMLLLTVVVGAAILAPYVGYQDVLDQSDRGRDLYCFKKTMDGATVYRDYWWIYGPAMPYYYSLFYRAMGVSVRSVLAGQCVLLLLCGVLIFLTAALFVSPGCACLASVVFWVYYPDFPHTYVYTGAVACMLLALYFLVRYIRRPGLPSLLLCAAAAAVAGMVKLNIGAALFCASLAAAFVADLLREGLCGLGGRLRRYAASASLFGGGLSSATCRSPGGCRGSSGPSRSPSRIRSAPPCRRSSPASGESRRSPPSSFLWTGATPSCSRCAWRVSRGGSG